MRRIVTRTARIVVRFLTAEYSCVMIVPCGFAKAQQMIDFAALLQIVENGQTPRRPTLIQRGVLGRPDAGWAPRRLRVA